MNVHYCWCCCSDICVEFHCWFFSSMLFSCIDMLKLNSHSARMIHAALWSPCISSSSSTASVFQATILAYFCLRSWMWIGGVFAFTLTLNVLWNVENVMNLADQFASPTRKKNRCPFIIALLWLQIVFLFSADLLQLLNLFCRYINHMFWDLLLFAL